jgi:STE24 endopeptidase
LADVYDKTAYKKSQDYKKANKQFSNISGTFSFALTLVFFFADGFKYVDDFARGFSDNSILVALIFFGVIMLG